MQIKELFHYFWHDSIIHFNTNTHLHSIKHTSTWIYNTHLLLEQQSLNQIHIQQEGSQGTVKRQHRIKPEWCQEVNEAPVCYSCIWNVGYDEEFFYKTKVPWRTNTYPCITNKTPEKVTDKLRLIYALHIRYLSVFAFAVYIHTEDFRLFVHWYSWSHVFPDIF